MSPDMSLVTDTLGYDIYWCYRGLYLLISVFLPLSLGAGSVHRIMDTSSIHPPSLSSLVIPGSSQRPLQYPVTRGASLRSLQLAHRPNFLLSCQGEGPRWVASNYSYIPMQTFFFSVAVATTLRGKLYFDSIFSFILYWFISEWFDRP